MHRISKGLENKGVSGISKSKPLWGYNL